MTLNPTANRREVLNGSGIFGQQLNWAFSVPDSAKVETTGGVSSQSFKRGTTLNTSGASSGDTGELLGVEKELSDRTARRVIGFRIFLSSSPSDVLKVGSVNVNNLDTVDKQTVIDFTNEQFIFDDGSTFDLSGNIEYTGGNGLGCVLEIYSDSVADESTIKFWQNGFSDGPEFSETRSTYENNMYDGIAGVQSNGNGDARVALQFVKDSIELRDQA